MWLQQDLVLRYVRRELLCVFHCWAIRGRWQPSSLGSGNLKHILSNQGFPTNLNDTRAMIPWRADLRNPSTSFQRKVQSEIHRINGVPSNLVTSLKGWSLWQRRMKQVSTHLLSSLAQEPIELCLMSHLQYSCWHQ
jgi:hypothetical protein